MLLRNICVGDTLRLSPESLSPADTLLPNGSILQYGSRHKGLEKIDVLVIATPASALYTPQRLGIDMDPKAAAGYRDLGIPLRVCDWHGLKAFEEKLR